MKKIIITLLSTLFLAAMLTACGGGGGGGEAGSPSSAIDPFDPEIFNVEEGGIVFNYTVSVGAGKYSYITDVDIENQLPEDDIRSTFKYEIVPAEDGSDWLEELSVGQKVAVEVTPPDDFWDDHELTETKIDFTIPPVPHAYVRRDMVTDEFVTEHFPEIEQQLRQVIEGRYYRYADETSGAVKDLIDTENISLTYYSSCFVVTAMTHEKAENGSDIDILLGDIACIYNDDKELVATFVYRACDSNGKFYYFKDEDHMVPNSDDVGNGSRDPDGIEGDISWIDDLPAGDRYLYYETSDFTDLAPDYTYNYNTGELTKVSEE